MEPASIPWLAFMGVVLTVIGGVIGAAINDRGSKRTATDHLVDQLQEELSGYRKSNDARSTLQDARILALEDTNASLLLERDTLRGYAHILRADIYAGKQPPPADWPSGVLQ